MLIMKCFYNRFILTLCWNFFFLFLHFAIDSLKKLFFWDIIDRQNKIHVPCLNILESYSDILYPHWLMFFSRWMKQHTLLSIFSPNAKQKQNKKLLNFKSSFKQSNHIYRSVQKEMMDTISASTMSYSNFLIFFDSL